MRITYKVLIVASSGLLAMSMLPWAQSIPEAPAGFDGLSNGMVAQNVMDDAGKTFQEVENVEVDGLGPVYNDAGCVNCHQNIAVGGASQTLEFRAGHNDSTRPSSSTLRHGRGDTNGSTGEFVAATAITANGTPIPERSLINQRATCPEAQSHVTNADNIRAARLSLALFGDAFVEAVPDQTLLSIAKRNGGEAIMVDVLEAQNVQEVGRFGWKDQHASLLSFSGDAYVNEMGITNRLFPNESVNLCGYSGAEPNDTSNDIDAFTTFMRALKAPPRGPITPAVNQGQAIFEAIGCNSCHVETMVTAPAGTAIHGAAFVVPEALGGKQFHPFGDFLLHNIGTGDGIVQNGPADTQYKVRTMPLWGLRTRTQLLHDGSAGTYLDAIEAHHGEAADEASKFNQLTATQKQLLIQFLGSL